MEREIIFRGRRQVLDLRTGRIRPRRRKRPAAGHLRAFAAAKLSRLNEDFLTSLIKTNKDIRDNLKALVARSRELAKNSSDYRKYLALCRRNIIGENGMVLQSRIRRPRGKPDAEANMWVEDAWRRFCRRGKCTVDRRHSMRSFDKLLVTAWKVDGEVFIRRVRGFRNDARIAFQLLDPMACDVDLNQPRTATQPKITMGIELDEWDAPVAYWFLSARTDSDWLGYDAVYNPDPARKHVRIPAAEIMHFYDVEFPGQVRGFPFGQAAMQSIYTLGAYFYTELVAADVGSRKMGFFIPPPGMKFGGRPELEDDDESDASAPQRIELTQEAQPAQFDILPAGMDFKEFSPQHPHGNFEPMTKAQKRNIANGLDVSYNTFANDLEGVNFSSMRHGLQDERDSWKDQQNAFLEGPKSWMYENFLAVQLMLTDKYSVTELDRFAAAATWQCKRWAWIKPTEDIRAAHEEIRIGATTPQKVAAERGGDFDDNVDQIAEASQRLAAAVAPIAGLLSIRPAESPPLPAENTDD